MPQTSVGTSGIEIVGYNGQRKGILLRNIASDGTLYIDTTSPASVQTSSAPFILRPGEGIAILARGKNADLVLRQWSCRSTLAGTTLAWEELYGDDTEFFIATISNTIAGTVSINNHYAEEQVLADNIIVASGGNLASAVVDFSIFALGSFQVSTTGNSTVTLQVSDDQTTWYEPKTVADANITWNCNNENISFAVPLYARYLRIFVQNTAGANNTVRVVFCGES